MPKDITLHVVQRKHLFSFQELLFPRYSLASDVQYVDHKQISGGTFSLSF